jgi:hypothetical protein
MRRVYKKLFLIFCSIFCFAFFSENIHAQIPANTQIACDDNSIIYVRDAQGNMIPIRQDEFHSLRPYQANVQCTAQTADLATYCGNDLTIKETITKTYSGGNEPGCTTAGDTVTCNYNVTVPTHTITIDLSDADFPFMGNTGNDTNTGEKSDVINSQNEIDANVGLEASEALTDAAKVNNYVGWYLNGTVNHAEYPLVSLENIAKLIDYSGPINKLLSQDSQFLKRTQTIENAVGMVLAKNGGRTGVQISRHSQVVGCSIGLNILGLQISDFPVPCNTANSFSDDAANFFGLKRYYQLKDWTSQTLIDLLSYLTPPLLSDYEHFVQYYTATKAWRGNICPYIQIPYEVPIIGGQSFVLCLPDILQSNFHSYLFNNIPYTSTEDVPGNVAVEKASPAANNTATITNTSFTGNAAELFFPHVLESDQLASILQDTYTPKGLDKTGTSSDVSTQTSCSMIDVRSNKGDNLFATSIVGQLGYNASFTCKFDAPQQAVDPVQDDGCSMANINARCYPDNYSCSRTYGQQGCQEGRRCGLRCYPPGYTPVPPGDDTSDACTMTNSSAGCYPDNYMCVDSFGQKGCQIGRKCGLYCYSPGPIGSTAPQKCEVDVYIDLSTKTNIPSLEDVWSRLVAGPMSVFKRIFPKTNVAGSVGQIKDIAGSTNIKYSGSGGTNVTDSDTDLKFPHIGGISEYFLKGIQTALRPKGYGEGIMFKETPVAAINCNQNIPEISYEGLNKAEAIRLTNIWYSPPGKPYFEECNNDVIQRAIGKNIDPIFALAIWIHESDASNYESAGNSVEDFGIHNHPGVPTTDFTKQLNEFLNLPDNYYSICGNKNMTTFISMFWYGNCVPANQNEADNVAAYIDSLNAIYSIIAPGVALPNYPN